MEPLTALALAGNIIQFVEFGCKLLSRTGELYKSSAGSLSLNDEVELATTDLQSLIARLQDSFLSWDRAALPSPDDHEGLASFQRVCDEAAKVAKELVEKLNNLKLNGKHRKLTSLKLAVKSLWNENEVFSLVKRLSALRENLVSHVLFSIRANLNTESLKTSARFESLDLQTRQILISMVESSEKLKSGVSQDVRASMNAFTITISQLLGRLEHMNKCDHLQTREIILERLYKRQGFRPIESQLAAGIEMLSVSDSSERLLRSSIQEAIFRSLDYASMTNRYDGVLEAHPETFKWTFVKSANAELTWSNISDWLKDGSGVYWVCGKAGSGKSTLMKHIYDHSRTRELLGEWAAPSSFCLASFFFWNSGTIEQKSQTGLLRSLLSQILKQCPDLLPIVFPVVWARCYSFAVKQDGMIWNYEIEPWTLQNLKVAVKALMSRKEKSLKIVLLIDGLDEFDGDHEEMAELMHELSSFKNVKICLSSRPWVIFEDRFGSSPMLRLQNLTGPDIEKYVRDKLHCNSAYQRLVASEPLSTRDLAHEIVDKAAGVFLWVKLVVQSLLNGIRNRDELSHLWKRFDLMPTELKALYGYFLTLIEPIYLPWVSKAFQIVQISQNNRKLRLPLTVTGFLLAADENLDATAFQSNLVAVKNATRGKTECLETNPPFLPVNQNERIVEKLTTHANMVLQKKCEDTSVRLTSRCAGFLEVSNVDGKITPHSLVQYFHRTARDFIEMEDWSELGLQTSDIDFNPSTAMMRSYFISLQLPPILIESQRPLAKRNDVLGIVGDLMVYAHYANSDRKSHEIQFLLLDLLLSKMKVYDGMINGRCNHQWMVDMISNEGWTYPVTTFLELSTLYDLTAYVQRKISKQRTMPNQAATHLLRYLLQSQYCSTNDSFPLLSVEMVKALLEIGAEPNGNHSTSSPFESLLLFLANRGHPKRHFHREHNTSCVPGSHRCEQLMPLREIGILLLLVRANANPTAEVTDLFGKRKTALEVIKTVTLKEFPSETALLLRELQQRIRSAPKSRKRRIRDEGVIVSSKKVAKPSKASLGRIVKRPNRGLNDGLWQKT